MLNIGWSLVFNIINLIVLYLAMKKFLIGPVTRIMDQRRQLIEGGLAGAREKEQQADELKAQYEAALGSAKEESRRILEDSKKTAKEEEERILREANEKARVIMEKNQKDLEVQKEQMLGEMQSQVAQLAVAAAEKVLGTKMDSQGDLDLYDQFLNSAGDAYDADSL